MEFLFPNLPEELGLEILTRSPYSTHRIASRVCRRWRDLLLSRGFYNLRKQAGFTRKLACLIQVVGSDVGPTVTDSSALPKPGESANYRITVFDPLSRSFERVDPVPKYPNGLPLFSQLATCEGKLILMGGWDPVSFAPVIDLFVYDLSARQWTKGREMPSKRSFFAIGSLNGKVYVAGGHDENKTALNTAFCYDLRDDKWTELPRLSQDRDECQGVVMGNGFWVISGYGTDTQGVFEDSAEFYDLDTGQWTRVEHVWESGRCPRACAGLLGKDGKMINWSNLDAETRVQTCGVILGELTLVSGSAYQGAPQGFYVGKMKEGLVGKLSKIKVAGEFSGFVRSGCCVEI